MILGLGIDICNVDRMAAALGRSESGFREQVFTAAEIAACEGRPHPAGHYAAHFAAKEAVVKALAEAGGRGSFWQDIEIASAGAGATVRLRGRARVLADGLGARRVLVSLARTRGLATATAVLEG